MKKLVLLLITVMFAVAVNAQTSYVATLSHEGEISTFYSSSALKEAYASAADGDIITLSSGVFHSVDFDSKKVTVRGAGMLVNSNPTLITGTTKIDIPASESTDEIPFCLEGLVFTSQVFIGNLNNATIQKCNFDRVESVFNGRLDNGRFLHCFINYLSLVYLEPCSVSYINCYLKDMWWTQDYSSTRSITNCTLNSASLGFPMCGTYTNCLFISDRDICLPDQCMAVGCIYVGDRDDFFSMNSYSYNNKTFSAATPVFKDGTETYELLDEWATTWLGNDGTQVGIHGGGLPYSPYGVNPRITKFDVSSKTTADGKLSVDIEVKAN